MIPWFVTSTRLTPIVLLPVARLIGQYWTEPTETSSPMGGGELRTHKSQITGAAFAMTSMIPTPTRVLFPRRCCCQQLISPTKVSTNSRPLLLRTFTYISVPLGTMSGPYLTPFILYPGALSPVSALHRTCIKPWIGSYPQCFRTRQPTLLNAAVGHFQPPPYHPPLIH